MLLGIDLGTTVVKVCAFDARTGALVARASDRLRVRALSNGHREQRLADVERSLRGALAEVRQAVGEAWNRVEGIGVAAQGGSTIIADRATGRPRTPMILWNDTRGRAYAPQVSARFPADFWRRFALREASPAGLGRLLHMKARTPELFSRDAIHAGAGDYLFHRLTGVWRQEAGSAIQIGPYDAANRRLDGTPLELLGLPLSFVPPLRTGHDTAPLSREGARLTLLRPGIPVAGPYIDQEAGYLSAASAGGRPLQLSLGTAWVGNMVLPDDLPGGSPFQLVLPSPTGTGRLVVQPLLTGNTAWDWALDRFVPAAEGDRFAAAAAAFARDPLPPSGLGVIPWFAQANPFLEQAHGGGLFWGMSPQTTPQDLLRAVATGMCCEAARVFAAVAEAGAIDAVAVTGGASNAAYFRTLLAGLFAPLPVLREVDDDLAVARGALHAFGGRAPRGRTRRVPVPGEPLLGRIRAAFDTYARAFRHTYGAVSIGRPFNLEVRRT